MLTPTIKRWNPEREEGTMSTQAASLLSGAHYLVRFDDICPTMNWTVWEAIEAHLVRNGVRPILAVVPDNQDPFLMVEPPKADFWDRVREWQAKGYTIALHGYQHLYVNQERGLLRLTPNSEFAGLSREEQQAKLSKGLAIFARHGIRADAWVAPSHSFDATTVEILRELGIPVISDGLEPLPFTDDGGMTWIPQQLWSFQSMPSGVWTICNHHNSWTDKKVQWFGGMLNTYSKRMTDVATVLEAFAGRKRSWMDSCQAYCRLIWMQRIRPILSRFLVKIVDSRPASA
jgi:hypothetical protein